MTFHEIMCNICEFAGTAFLVTFFLCAIFFCVYWTYRFTLGGDLGNNHNDH